MTERWVWFNVVAPWWRVPFRPVPGLGGARPWLRWLVVEEVRPRYDPTSKLVVSGYERHSLHWTYGGARRAAHEAQLAVRDA